MLAAPVSGNRPEMKKARRAIPAHASPVGRYRQRARGLGKVRVEVHVHERDADLVRRIAGALNDPLKGPKSRAVLVSRFGSPPARGFKALLAAAPLDGIELERGPDTGRDVDL